MKGIGQCSDSSECGRRTAGRKRWTTTLEVYSAYRVLALPSQQCERAYDYDGTGLVVDGYCGTVGGEQV